MLVWKEENSAQIAETVLSKLGGKSCISLRGDLGAGKTALAKALGKSLGIKEKINSPTFVIMKIYELDENSRFEKLAHMDAYRLLGKEDIKAFDIEEYMSAKNTLFILEWPERVFEKTPEDFLNIKIEFGEKENERILKFAD